VLDLNLSYRKNTLSLVATDTSKIRDKESETYEERIDINSFTEDFIVVFIDFEIRKNRFNFQLGLENTGVAGEQKTIPLTNSLSGTGVFQFGENLPASGISTRRNERIISPSNIQARYPAFILDELGVFYTRENAAKEEPAVKEPYLTAETENSETI
jgi:hypothetical protein